MRIGILGGTFDPVHLGHLLLAEACKEQASLDEIRFIPTANPPHKDSDGITPAKDRINMLELATVGYPEYVVDPRETKREGIVYTVDTLEELTEENPDDEWFLIFGADWILDFKDTWKEAEKIASMCSILAANRGDAELPSKAEMIERLGEAITEKIQFVTMPGVELSSTTIREKTNSQTSIRFQVPRAVEIYIRENGLYR